MKGFFLLVFLLLTASLVASELVTVIEHSDRYEIGVTLTVGIGKTGRDWRLTAPFILVAIHDESPVYRTSLALIPAREPGSRVGTAYLPEGLRWDEIMLYRADLAYRGASLTVIPPTALRPLAALRRPSRFPLPPLLPPYTVEKIQDTGPDEKRIVWIIMGDGYTAAEMEKFKDDTAVVLDDFFATSPWKERRGAFNIYRADVVSNESGADHPEQNPPTTADTALGAFYGCYGIARLICVDEETVLGIANSIAAHDAALVIVNDPVYGGSGGATILVASTNLFSSEIAIHEFGHSFGLLADEYENPYPGYPDGDWEPNVSYAYDFDREKIKWGEWISPLTPLPTPENAGYHQDIGMFEGARYQSTGMFRPQESCKMRRLGDPFCAVCTEAQALQIYNRAGLFDTAEPAPDTIVSAGADLTVTVNFLPCEALSVSFALNGSPLSGAVCSVGTCTQMIKQGQLTPGDNTLTARISDTSGEIRVDPAHLAETILSWTIRAETPDGDTVVPDEITDAPAGEEGAAEQEDASAEEDASSDTATEEQTDADAETPADGDTKSRGCSCGLLF